MPFTPEAMLLAIDMLSMWLTAPCLVRPKYRVPRKLLAWGIITFMTAFAMSILHLSWWMDTMPVFREPMGVRR